MTMAKNTTDKQVDIDFESHPPIERDHEGIATLLKQTLLHFADCHALAKYLIEQKSLTQVIAQGGSDEEGEDDDEEPDDDIYGVSSIIDLNFDKDKGDDASSESRSKLLKFIENKCSKFKDMLSDASKTESSPRVCMVVNERYINLPPQLSLPTLKSLTEGIQDRGYTHLIFISKILVSSRGTNTKLPSKKSKTASSSSTTIEPLVFINPEEEIISEQADYYSDIDVSGNCDENATWSFNSDIKYAPHRRILVVNYNKWSKILKLLEKELN